MKRLAFTLTCTLLVTVSAHAASPIKWKTDKGQVIAGSNSYKTLYTYDNDKDGRPTCLDKCAEAWPPHIAEYWDTPREPFGTVELEDGKKQWTLKGMPLYFSVLDEKKGTANGDGIDGKWNAARPD